MLEGWEQWKAWFDLVQCIGIVVISIWVFLDKGRARNTSAIQQIADEYEALDRRVLSLENRAATHEDIAQLRAEIEGMKSTLSQVDQVTNRIYSYLLSSKGEK